MSALTAPRRVTRISGERFTDRVAPDVTIYEGALVVLKNGLASPAHQATGLKARGVAEATVTGGGDPPRTVTSVTGVFGFVPDYSINFGHVGQLAYIVDDQTVSVDDAGGSRSVAGEIVDFNPSDISTVFVRI